MEDFSEFMEDFGRVWFLGQRWNAGLRGREEGDCEREFFGYLVPM
jgi:hypothetical protein